MSSPNVDENSLDNDELVDIEENGDINKDKNEETTTDHDKAEESEEEDTYEVESVLAMKKNKRGKRTFKVHWKGYGEDDDSWEPEENLEGAREVLDAYLKDKGEPVRIVKGAKARKSSSTRTPDSTSAKRAHSEDASKASDDEGEDFEEPSKKKGRKAQKNVQTSSKSSSSRGSSSRATRNSGVSAPKSKQTPLKSAVSRRMNISQDIRWLDGSGSESDTDNETAKTKDAQEEVNGDTNGVICLNGESSKNKRVKDVDESEKVSESPPPAEKTEGEELRSEHSEVTHDASVQVETEIVTKVTPSRIRSNSKQPIKEVVKKHEEVLPTPKKQRQATPSATVQVEENNVGKSGKKGTKEPEVGTFAAPIGTPRTRAAAGESSNLSFLGIWKDLKKGELHMSAYDSAAKHDINLTLEQAMRADIPGVARFFNNAEYMGVLKFEQHGNGK